MVWNVCRRVLRHAQDAEDAFQATFLVLLRRADAIRKLGSVASWLHGVALRTAQKARVQSSRRHVREAAAAVNPLTPEAEIAEQNPALEEELARLPEKYRLPLVLCYYQGQTLECAAQSLGWPLGTVAGRMSRAREQLRLRLERRGVALTAVTVAAVLAERAANAQPAALVEKTLHTCLAWLSPEKTVPAAVLSLAQGVLQSMFWSKVKLVAGSVALVAFLALGAGLLLKDAWATVPQTGKAGGQQNQGDSGGKPVAPPPNKKEERILGFQVSGKIVEVLVKPGDRVKVGQVLAKLDSALIVTEVERCEADVERNKVTLQAAEQEFKVTEKIYLRDMQLFQQNAIPKQELDISQFRMEKTKLDVEAIKKGSLVMSEANLRKAKLELERHTLLSGFDGVVGVVHRHKGESIEAHNPFIIIRLVKRDDGLPDMVGD
jgi:RNA polymerase sigma factor (sigma-70 family)